MLPLILLLTLAPAQKLPAGVLRYWSCDDDEGAAWRDNHWQAGGSPGTAYDTAEKVEGAASLRLTGPDKGELWVFSLARFVQVEQDGRFVLRFQARTRGVQNMAFVRILAHEPTAPDKYRPIGWVKLGEQRPEFTLPADSDWTRYEVPVGPLPGGTGRLFFYLGIAGPGTVWFDDFSLALAGCTPGCVLGADVGFYTFTNLVMKLMKLRRPSIRRRGMACSAGTLVPAEHRPRAHG